MKNIKVEGNYVSKRRNIPLMFSEEDTDNPALFLIEALVKRIIIYIVNT